MKNKRFLIVAMLCVVMLFSLIVFVACDDNNNENNNNGDNADYGELFVDIDEDMLYKSLNGFIGYAFKNTVSDNENESISATMDVSVFSNDLETVGGNGYKGNMFFGIYTDSTQRTDEWGIPLRLSSSVANISFYDSEDNARIALPFVEEKMTSDDSWFEDVVRVYQNGSLIIAETKSGFFDELLAYDIPSDKKDDKALKFFMNMFNKEMHGNNREVSFGEGTRLCITNAEIVNGGCWAMPANGNREKAYYFWSYDYVREFYGDEPDEAISEYLEELNVGYYTDDSYVKTEKINGKDYCTYFSQHKAGIQYEESEEFCKITNIYFDGMSVDIPFEHNGKPVKYIDYYISVEGLTDVHFDGTKAQWEEISQNGSRWKSVVVHCSDGIIENGAQ